MTKNRFYRLEESLRIWEDKCFYFRTAYLMKQKTGARTRTTAICPQIGPILNWQSFRKYLLRDFATDSQFDLEKYCGTVSLKDQLNPQLLPYHLWHWTRSSRRIYRLTGELQLLLRATNLGDVRWDELVLPFGSFMLHLPDPIVDPKYQNRYDAILVTRTNDNDGERINFILLNEKLADYTALTLQSRKRMELLLKKKRWTQLARKLNRLNLRHRECQSIMISIKLDLMEKTPIEEILPSDNLYLINNVDALNLVEQASRIIAGFCLYLRTLPASSPHQSDWSEANKTLGLLDTRCITNEAQVCTVQNCFKLTADEKQVLERKPGVGGYELSAHFRTGHWRRPPGQGSDPSAERTVWVRPALVRRDRVAPGSLPEGSEETI